MPSIAQAGRNVVIDKRSGRYLSFPDVCLTDDGRLLVVYRECDRHIEPQWSRLLLRESTDLGATWSAPRMLCATGSHCPRIQKLSDGQIVIMDDGSRMQFWSVDQGRTFAQAPTNGLEKSMFDRVLQLDRDVFLTTSHDHRGQCAAPMAGQPPTEQMVYRSQNRGKSWRAYSILGHDECLMYCEASMVKLPDGRLLALLRENSGVFEPTYARFSSDNGATWSDPVDTPMIGHRPTALVTSQDKLLTTYRNVGPDMGVSAWLGEVDELGRYAVHGHVPKPECLHLMQDGLLLECTDREEARTFWALRPLSDPRRAHANLSLDLTPGMCAGNTLHLHLGCWWRIEPGTIRPLLPRARRSSLPAGRVNIRLEYSQGEIALRINGRLRRRVQLKNVDVNARPIIVGNAASKQKMAEVSCRWNLHAAELHISDPGYGREYSWQWTPEMGMPHAEADRRILTLADPAGAWGGDMGYNGVIELPDGSFYCVYHIADGQAPDYDKGTTTWVEGIRFDESDLT
ncbi:MAG: sialidase family protein [Desulfovibrio sp.]|uniref:sialidase family protein n=1 Tax=Desulfovibrio sp. 7SRBS1 TaxID=3378064 RepID=UPI003B406934